MKGSGGPGPGAGLNGIADPAAMGKQRSSNCLIDVPATPTLPNANFRYYEAPDGAVKLKPGCTGSFQLEVQASKSC